MPPWAWFPTVSAHNTKRGSGENGPAILILGGDDSCDIITGPFPADRPQPGAHGLRQRGLRLLAAPLECHLNVILPAADFSAIIEGYAGPRPSNGETMAVDMINRATSTNFKLVSMFGTGQTRSVKPMLAKPIWRKSTAFQVSALLYAALISDACSPSRWKYSGAEVGLVKTAQPPLLVVFNLSARNYYFNWLLNHTYQIHTHRTRTPDPEIR